jgi:cell division protein FtsI (penicillin-binding protein 3)/stage V sporulation protein D (sporulation-specific penicillin-binding protein)
MDPDKALRVLNTGLSGLHALKEQKRIYPNGSLLAHVLGYCDIDDLGLAGTEKFWNRELYSPPSLTMIGRDGGGNPVNLFGLPAAAGDRSEGKVQLAIDARIQHILEHYLKEGSEAWKARWAAAVCLDPRTGDVLGMASWPGFDPNRRSTFKTSRLRNNVIGRVYEPGSTFKPIIMGMALDRKVISTRDRFYSPGFIRIADHVIQNYHRKAFGWEYPTDILVNSCNVGMSQIGMKMNVLATHGSLHQWGFGRPTGVELPGEEQGLLPAPDQWVGVVPANIAIGQGIAVTPLQLALAIGAIANGGHLLRPHLVQQAWDSGNVLVYQAKREIVRDVLSPATAEWLRSAMRDVVRKGSGKRADTPAVEMAGKTGTAQVAEKGIYAKGRFVTSFVGYWPWDVPRYLVLVSIGEPVGRDLSGGKVAAPIVRQIAEAIQAMHID